MTYTIWGAYFVRKARIERSKHLEGWMGLTSSYLVAISRWEELLTTIRGVQAPEKFTLGFLKDLGFTSSNEHLFHRKFGVNQKNEKVKKRSIDITELAASR
jgi:hypothetical protein